ncbi:Uncharacterised protein [Mycobacteroides abscessus subsp. abscessus]|nr:Uncharacterised protein [Mycobacteroides abscessus subsp. abscessus]
MYCWNGVKLTSIFQTICFFGPQVNTSAIFASVSLRLRAV